MSDETNHIIIAAAMMACFIVGMLFGLSMGKDESAQYCDRVGEVVMRGVLYKCKAASLYIETSQG